uniref:Uncharacterized protein n=1 Tax=Oryza meridionalis TaxID=40149 RepID=A0A0E0EQA0_9ORYZ
MAMASEGKANIISDQYAAVSSSSLCCSLLKASRTGDCQHQPPPRLPTRPADHYQLIPRDEHILSPLTWLTYQGDTALHMVAASGSDDAENFLKSADIICRSGRAMELLVTPNWNGDTPLHSAATAGNLAMVRKLIHLRKCTADGSAAAAAATAAMLRRENKSGETALHGAIRFGSVNMMRELLEEDPELVCVPRSGTGTSPLYLAVLLGHTKIVEEIHKVIAKAPNRISFCGPDGQTAMHAAVLRGKVFF